MKKNYLAFGAALALCLGLLPVSALGAERADLSITKSTFPDAGFRSVVEALPGGEDGVFTPSELRGITELQCAGQDIVSLEGVRYFSELEVLNCADNRLLELNVSGNPKLTQLYCDSNELIELDVSQNPALTQLDCSFNYLQELDVSRNPKLESLSVDIMSHDMALFIPARGVALTELLGLWESPAEVDGGMVDKAGHFTFNEGAEEASFRYMRNTVTLKKPMEPVTRTLTTPEGAVLEVTTDHRGRVSARVQAPENWSGGAVTVPLADPTPGTVAVAVEEEGVERVLPTSYPVKDGVRFPVQGDMEVKLADRTRRFYDVAGFEWYRPYVDFVSARKLFTGVAWGEFAPDLPMTRAMLAVVLRGMDEDKTPGPNAGFPDVAEGAWYADAVSWAARRKIVSGYPDGRFGPEDPITREQLALMLYNCAGAPAVQSEKLPFTDSGSVSGYARTAVDWAVQNGLLCGVGGNRLDPGGEATRAMVAAMLMRFVAVIG